MPQGPQHVPQGRRAGARHRREHELLRLPELRRSQQIFAHGGARRGPSGMGVEFLGEIPLDIAVRETSDEGRPIVVSDPERPNAAAYRDIAQGRISAKLAGTAQRQARASSSSRANPSRLDGVPVCCLRMAAISVGKRRSATECRTRDCNAEGLRRREQRCRASSYKRLPERIRAAPHSLEDTITRGSRRRVLRLRRLPVSARTLAT